MGVSVVINEDPLVAAAPGISWRSFAPQQLTVPALVISQALVCPSAHAEPALVEIWNGAVTRVLVEGFAGLAAPLTLFPQQSVAWVVPAVTAQNVGPGPGFELNGSRPPP